MNNAKIATDPITHVTICANIDMFCPSEIGSSYVSSFNNFSQNTSTSLLIKNSIGFQEVKLVEFNRYGDDSSPNPSSIKIEKSEKSVTGHFYFFLKSVQPVKCYWKMYKVEINDTRIPPFNEVFFCNGIETLGVEYHK